MFNSAAQGGDRQLLTSQDHLRTALLSELQRKQILEEILEGEAAINPGLTRVMPKLPKIGSAQQKVA